LDSREFVLRRYHDMFVTSAWALGLFGVFIAGYFVTALMIVLLNKIAAMIKGAPIQRSGYVRENNVDKLCVAGGIIAVVLVLRLLIIGGRELSNTVWIGLIVLGILIGFSTFLLNEPKNYSRSWN